MDNNQITSYIGKQYPSCAHMAMDIMTNEFEKQIPIVVDDVNFDNRLDVIKKLNAIKVSEKELQEGDIVLMGSKGSNSHIGIIVISNGYPHCLHHLNRASVCCHRLAWLKQIAITVDGYYRL